MQIQFSWKNVWHEYKTTCSTQTPIVSEKIKYFDTQNFVSVQVSYLCLSLNFVLRTLVFCMWSFFRPDLFTIERHGDLVIWLWVTKDISGVVVRTSYDKKFSKFVTNRVFGFETD